MKRRITAFLFALHLLGIAQVWAQEAPQTTKTQKQEHHAQTLEPVVVTAGRIEEKAKNVTEFVTIIPQEEIQKNHYQDMGSLLRNYGMQVDTYGPGSGLSQIAVRGVRSSAMGSDLQGSVLILMDGRRIGTDNIFMIPMINIERVEIIRGPASVQYGTSAVGGVVNVITRRGTEKFTASAEGGLGSWETYRGQGSLAGKYGMFDFSGGISYLTAGDYHVGGGDAQRYPNTGMNNRTAYSASAGVNFSEEHRIGMTALGMRADDMGSPGYFNDIQHKDYTDRFNYSYDFMYEGGCKDFGLSWKARYFTGKNNYLSDQHNDGTGMNYFESYTDYQGSQAQLTFKKSVLSLTGGADWLRYDTAMQGYWYSRHEDSAYTNIGLFGLAKLSLFDDRFILSAGARHDDYRLELDRNAQYLNRVTPSFGAAWHVTNWLTLKGNYGESYRIPDATALLGFKGMFVYAANPNLQPEEAKTYDAGFEVRHNSLNIGLNWFETEYRNKMLTRLTPEGETQYYNAAGKIRLKGLEGNLSYDIGEAFEWSFRMRPYMNFTALTDREGHGDYSNAGAEDYKNRVNNKVLNVNDFDLACGLNFAYPGIGFEADARVTYIGRQYVRDFNPQNQTYNEVVRAGGKATADLFLRQTVYSRDNVGTLSIKAEIRNIFNEKYALIKDYPQPGRSFYLGLRYDY